MENIVRKGEIACKKEFLLFSQCFLPYMALIFYYFSFGKGLAMENIVRKGEIACNKQFLLFSQCFLPYMARFFYYLWFGKGLTHYQTTNFRLFQTERVCTLTLSQTSPGFYVSAVKAF